MKLLEKNLEEIYSVAANFFLDITENQLQDIINHLKGEKEKIKNSLANKNLKSLEAILICMNEY